MMRAPTHVRINPAAVSMPDPAQLHAVGLAEQNDARIWATSLIVAEGCELEHASVIKTIRKHQIHFEQFGFLGFQFQKNRGTQGAQTEYALWMFTRRSGINSTIC